MVAASAVMAWLVFMPVEFEYFARSVRATALFISNVRFEKESGYFDMSAQLKPLLHTWSLAVEEQFYIVFPVALTLLAKLDRRRIPWVLVSLFVASLAASAWYVHRAPVAAFYLSQFRGWELLLGALLAFDVLPRSTRPVIGECLAALGILLIGYAVFAYSDSTVFPGLAALVPCLGAGRHMLPTKKPTHKLRGGYGLDLFAQRPDRQPMYAGQQSPVAPFDFVARSLRELTAQYCTARFEAQQRLLDTPNRNLFIPNGLNIEMVGSPSLRNQHTKLTRSTFQSGGLRRATRTEIPPGKYFPMDKKIVIQDRRSVRHQERLFDRLVAWFLGYCLQQEFILRYHKHGGFSWSKFMPLVAHQSSGRS